MVPAVPVPATYMGDARVVETCSAPFPAVLYPLSDGGTVAGECRGAPSLRRCPA